jgi:predicted acylesterase/phospholipase RssA
MNPSPDPVPIAPTPAEATNIPGRRLRRRRPKFHPTPVEPLNTIGLALSGGGFRAAAFTLGCLSYLNRCRFTPPDGPATTLLARVAFISSTSGGSFTNLLYARDVYAGKPFTETYRTLRKFMDGETLVRRAMNLLNDPAVWQRASGKQRNLANAFSLVYDELFDGATLDPLCQPNVQQTLNQICVNSTEFQSGISFRFQNIDGTAQRRGFVGNLALNLRPDRLAVIRKLKLADIMAASSCFPAGMEPLQFPRDFSYHETGNRLTQMELREAIFCRNMTGQETEMIKQEPVGSRYASVDQLTSEGERNETNPVASTPMATTDHGAAGRVGDKFSFSLMDGGIDDNQAIKGLMLADKRQKTRTTRSFDTFIACDVSGRYMTPFKAPRAERAGLNRLSLRLLAMGLGLLSAVPVIVGCLLTGTAQTAWTAIGLTLLSLEAVAAGLVWWYLRSAGGKGTWGRVLREFGGYFFTVPLGSLRQMLVVRLESVIKLSGDVMMKQIRRLTFEQFYDNPAWDFRRVTALIYELSSEVLPLTTARSEKSVGANSYMPSEAMQQMADRVNEMQTTLWFNGKDVTDKVRDQLIATGQFTMCYNLLQYIDQVLAPANKLAITPAYQDALITLKTALLADWELLQQKPDEFV